MDEGIYSTVRWLVNCRRQRRKLPSRAWFSGVLHFREVPSKDLEVHSIIRTIRGLEVPLTEVEQATGRARVDLLVPLIAGTDSIRVLAD